MSTAYSIGQMNQLGDSLEAAGFTPALVTKLQQFGDIARFKDVLLGRAEIVTMKHVIDLSAPAVLPKEWSEKDWEVIEHIEGPADFEWDPEKVKLWLSDQQKGDKSVEGNKLLKEIRKRGRTFNANMLDFLLAHPDLVSEDWQVVFFWDTVYRDRDSGYQCVRSLYRDGRRLRWSDGWLGYYWRTFNPAAVPASF